VPELTADEQARQLEDPVFHQLCNFIEDELKMTPAEFGKLGPWERVRLVTSKSGYGLDHRMHHADQCVPYNPYGDYKDILKRSESFVPLREFGDMRNISLFMHLDPNYVWMLHNKADMRMVTLFMTFMRHEHNFFPVRDYFKELFTRLQIGRNLETVCMRHKWPLRVAPEPAEAPVNSKVGSWPGFKKSKWDRTSKVQLVLAQNYKAAALELICETAWNGSNRDVLGIISGYMDDAVGSTVGPDMLAPQTIVDPRWKRLQTLVAHTQSKNACVSCKAQSGVDFEQAIGMDPDVVVAINVEPHSLRATEVLAAVHRDDNALIESELARADNHGVRAIPRTQPYRFMTLRMDDWKLFRKPDPLELADFTQYKVGTSMRSYQIEQNNERQGRYDRLMRIYNEQHNAACTCPIGVRVNDEIVGICNALKLCVWVMCL